MSRERLEQIDTAIRSQAKLSFEDLRQVVSLVDIEILTLLSKRYVYFSFSLSVRLGQV